MIVRELVALLSVKADKAGMQQANSGMNGLVGIAKAAAAAFAALKITQWATAAAKEVALLGDKFDKMSKRTDISTQALQEWSFVGNLAGTSIDQIEKAVRRLQYSVDQADQGVKLSKDGFRRLGIEIKDSNGEMKLATDLLPELADTLGQVENSTERAALAQQMLGRSGIALMPLLMQGSEAIREQVKELHELGAVMSEDLINISTRYIDNQERLDKMWLGVKFTIANEVLPIYIQMQEATLGWWKANRKLVSQHIGPIFRGIGSTVSGVLRFFGGLASSTLKWIDGLTGTEKAIAGIGLAVVVIAKLLQAGPIGKFFLLATLIALIIEDFQVWREGGESAIGDIIAALDEWLGVDTEQWFQDMGEGFKIFGDIGKDVLDTLFTTIFALVDLLINVWDEPTEAWEKFLFQMEASLAEKGITFGSAFTGITDAFKRSWLDWGNYFEFIFGRVVDSFKRSWSDWGKYFTGVLDGIKVQIKEFDEKYLGGLGSFLGKLGGALGKKLGLGEDETSPVLPSGKLEQLQGLNVLTKQAGATQFNPLVAPIAGRQLQQIINHNQYNLKVENAQGLDAEQLGRVIDKRFTEKTDQQNRATYRALVPSGG